jgi:hypothetical protein
MSSQPPNSITMTAPPAARAARSRETGPDIHPGIRPSTRMNPIDQAAGQLIRGLPASREET